MSREWRSRLIDQVTPLAADLVVTDVRIGVALIAVRLNHGQVGLAGNPGGDFGGVTAAGPLVGHPAATLLRRMLDTPSPASRAVGLAVANAVLAAQPLPTARPGDALAGLELTPADRVAMVGWFGPLLPRLRQLGCRLVVIGDRRGDGSPLVLTGQQPAPPGPAQSDRAADDGATGTEPVVVDLGAGRAALAECSVALVSGAVLADDRADEVLAALEKPRAAVLLGPSTPLAPGVFKGSALTQLSGAVVRDAPAVLRVVSEAGSTRHLKPWLTLLNLPVPV